MTNKTPTNDHPVLPGFTHFPLLQIPQFGQVLMQSSYVVQGFGSTITSAKQNSQ